MSNKTKCSYFPNIRKMISSVRDICLVWLLEKHCIHYVCSGGACRCLAVHLCQPSGHLLKTLVCLIIIWLHNSFCFWVLRVFHPVEVEQGFICKTYTHKSYEVTTLILKWNSICIIHNACAHFTVLFHLRAAWCWLSPKSDLLVATNILLSSQTSKLLLFCYISSKFCHACSHLHVFILWCAILFPRCRWAVLLLFGRTCWNMTSWGFVRCQTSEQAGHREVPFSQIETGVHSRGGECEEACSGHTCPNCPVARLLLPAWVDLHQAVCHPP